MSNQFVISLAAFLAPVAALAAGSSPIAACPSIAAGPTLASPCRHYSLKLNSLFTFQGQPVGLPPSQPLGLFLKARIDGAPPLRLLLDSGAKNIVLDKRTAARLGRSAGTAQEVVGLGLRGRAVKRVAPGTVEIGDLVLRDCEMLAVDSSLTDGIDGVIPLALFAGFLVRLDVPGRTLELDPYPPEPPLQDSAASGYSTVRADNSLLFLEAAPNPAHTDNESPSGYVLLDTGAAYNGVSAEAAHAWRNYRMLAPYLTLVGASGDTDGYLLPSGVHFHVGSRVVAADPAVVVDLSALSRHHRFAVAGLLGYPALRRSVVTVDYRDSLVRLDPK